MKTLRGKLPKGAFPKGYVKIGRLPLDLESKAEEPLSDMEREAFLETIRDLKETIRNANEMIRSLQSELDRSNRLFEQNQILIANLRSVIADLQKRLDEREKENADLRDLNNRHTGKTVGTP